MHGADDEALLALWETVEGGRASRQQASKQSAAQHDAKELLAIHGTASKASAPLQQSSRLQAAPDSEMDEDEDEDDAEPMIFTRLKRPAEAVAS